MERERERKKEMRERKETRREAMTVPHEVPSLTTT
jgi:hypothetical protein